MQGTTKWRRVTKDAPCGVCGKTSWCTVAEGAAHCMRVESEKPVESGGWIHAVEVVLPRLTRPVKRLTPDEVESLVRGCERHPRAQAQRTSLARRLGVSVRSLERLHVGCGADKRSGLEFSSWPERDARGAFTGLVRRYADGVKKTYPGTSHGLIYADDWRGDGRVVLVPEGGSDTAALLSLGLSAIGRPSNLGGVKLLTQLLKGYRGCVVVLGENDQKARETCRCGVCNYCWPGRFGAVETAKKLQSRGYRVWWCVLPDAKDVRAWCEANPFASAGDLLQVVRDNARRV